MEKQRSFSLKPTRFLVFSFTISFSIIFLIFVSIWVITDTPFVHQESHFQFNPLPSLRFTLKPLTVQTLTGFSGNFSASDVRNTILLSTHSSEPVSTSVDANLSSVLGLQKGESELAQRKAYASGGLSVNNSILVATHFRKPEITSGFAEKSVLEGVQRKENESEVLEGEAIKGNTIGKQQFLHDSTTVEKSEVSDGERIEEKYERLCDATKGRWVYDESYPLYTTDSCPYIDEGFDCEANGRLDKGYTKWRWQPHDCDIPRFNATNMLDVIRGKRLVFVGDSINRNQWESMLCLLMGAIKDQKRVYETRGQKITREKGNYSFKFVHYKCTVEYYVTHFLVHESKARVGKKRVQTLRIDTIDRGSSRWRGADILVFNTARWWTHYKTKAGINCYQEGDEVHHRLDVSVAFRKALTTWASWVDKHMKTSKKARVFFRSSSPSHFSGGQWNAGGHCKEASQPIKETSSIDHPEKNTIAEVIRQMQTPVTFLDVTSLSGYRPDGHPSVHGRRSGRSNPSRAQDCSHWCLPGVPDSWNELLYHHICSPI
ncbi:hypothetical protein RJ639_033568 [Escallonia herrerae]|uniref:Trichome birefringence-like N-terminal domain-containing protein n=1 Tax=Escallonia herrerae TaxID=1293975 RepID=A0AA88X0G4_9ASTE|nr:hypothetical protein RJ639_033568 [Escallonia herrerae]